MKIHTAHATRDSLGHVVFATEDEADHGLLRALHGVCSAQVAAGSGGCLEYSYYQEPPQVPLLAAFLHVAELGSDTMVCDAVTNEYRESLAKLASESPAPEGPDAPPADEETGNLESLDHDAMAAILRRAGYQVIPPQVEAGIAG